MGYCADQGETRFHIAAHSKQYALTLVKEAARHQTYIRWTDKDQLLSAGTLEEALALYGWQSVVNEQGDITGLRLQNEKLGDERALFHALAFCVKAGSYITMYGEDHEVWRWYFDGRQMVEQAGRISFE